MLLMKIQEFLELQLFNLQSGISWKKIISITQLHYNQTGPQNNPTENCILVTGDAFTGSMKLNCCFLWCRKLQKYNNLSIHLPTLYYQNKHVLEHSFVLSGKKKGFDEYNNDHMKFAHNRSDFRVHLNNQNCYC